MRKWFWKSTRRGAHQGGNSPAGQQPSSPSPVPYSELSKLIECFNTDPQAPDLLFLGDSVTERTSWTDRDTRTLVEMVSSELEGWLKVAAITHSAYHPGIYYHLLLALETMKYRPQCIILPVNMRCFSPQWHLNPLWQFDREIEILQSYTGDASDEIGELEARVPSPSLFKEFEETSVHYPCTSLNQIDQFLNIIESTPRWPGRKSFRLQQIFNFHYLHPLTRSHPKVSFLNNILNLLSRIDAALLLYITPINYQAGLRHVGSEFMRIYQNNVAVLFSALQTMSPNRFLFKDYSQLFSSDCFFNRDNATEHLNQQGRIALSQYIAQNLRQHLTSAEKQAHEFAE